MQIIDTLTEKRSSWQFNTKYLNTLKKEGSLLNIQMDWHTKKHTQINTQILFHNSKTEYYAKLVETNWYNDNK